MSNLTQHRSARVDTHTWDALDQAAAHYGGRSSVLRRLIRLYLRDEGTRAAVHAMRDELARNKTDAARTHA